MGTAAVPTPRVSGDFRRFIYLYNPIYLLSSVCMLASCVLLANDSVHKNVPLGQLLALVGTLFVYQACLFAIGAFLALSRNILRDGRTLLILDAIFLSDITFGNSELLTTRLSTGLAAGLLLLGLSLLRIHWIARQTGCNLRPHRFLWIFAQLAALVAIPAYLKHIDNGLAITQQTFYALWWIVALLLGLGLLVDHAVRRRTAPEILPARAAWVQPVYLLVPWLSLLLHLGVLHYVYDTTLVAAMAAPILIAVAMLLKRVQERREAWLGKTYGLQAICLIAAFLAGMNAPSSLELWGTSAAKLTLAALYPAIVYMYFRRQANWCLVAGAAVAAFALFGPTPQQILAAIMATLHWVGRCLTILIPATRIGWGVLGIVLSFLLLGLGLRISLHQPLEVDHRDDGGPTPPQEDGPLLPPVAATPDELLTTSAATTLDDPLPAAIPAAPET